MISQDEAINLTLQQTFDWGAERLPLSDCFGRILAEEVIADRPQPPFDRVTMDGICINFATYAKGQRFFPIEKLQAAGDAPTPIQDPTKCIEIMTGAALPGGVSTVIRYEDLTQEGNGFRLPDGILDRKNIHFSGSDLAAEGAVLLPIGTEIKTGALGMMATFGYATSLVKKMPKVAIISTGNELVDIATKTPLPQQIRRSNVHQLAALVSSKKIPVVAHHLVDDREKMTIAIRRLLRENDLLVFSGGVSKGKLDYLPEVLDELGVHKLFHRVAQRPGKPLWVGRTDGCMVFGLPGNPVSSLACLLRYVGPFIRKSLGLANRLLPHFPLANDYFFKPDLSLALTAKIIPGTKEQEASAKPVIGQGSGDATSLVKTEGFLLLSRGREQFLAGDRFPFLPLNELY